MKALITGASSGIGKDMSLYLSSLGYDLILVAQDIKKLEEVQQLITTKSRVIALDLSSIDNCYKLYDLVHKEKIDVLINNAGFGVFGEFVETDIDKEMKMIDVNIKAVHLLTKLFLKDMQKRDAGYILNVASSAAFQAGPLMASYYASKAYVLRLTTAINEELRKKNTHVHVCALCPGPVSTNFSKVANVEFEIKPLTSTYVAKYAIDEMFKKRMIIIPGAMIRLIYYFGRFMPTRFLLKMTYGIQRKKRKEL